jgi:hypothetical protein
MDINQSEKELEVGFDDLEVLASSDREPTAKEALHAYIKRSNYDPVLSKITLDRE